MFLQKRHSHSFIFGGSIRCRLVHSLERHCRPSHSSCRFVRADQEEVIELLCLINPLIFLCRLKKMRPASVHAFLRLALYIATWLQWMPVAIWDLVWLFYWAYVVMLLHSCRSSNAILLSSWLLLLLLLLLLLSLLVLLCCFLALTDQCLYPLLPILYFFVP